MNKSFKVEVIEFLIFGIIWIGIFSIPFFNQWGYASLDWDKLLSEWLRIFGFFMIFLINILLLIPKYLITKKYKTYIFSAISMIIIVLFFLCTEFINGTGFFSSKGMINNVGNKPDFFLGQFRKHRQRKDFLRTIFTHRHFH